MNTWLDRLRFLVGAERPSPTPDGVLHPAELTPLDAAAPNKTPSSSSPEGASGSGKGQESREKMILRMALFVVGGAIVGFLYHRFIGCRSGACPITANPYISTMYGALIGFLMART